MAAYNGPKLKITGLLVNLDIMKNDSWNIGRQEWYDLSGRENTGYLLGTPTISNVDGDISFANGQAESVNVPGIYDTNTGPDAGFLTSDFTVEIWVYPTSFSTTLHMTSFPDSSTLDLRANTSGEISVNAGSFNTAADITNWDLTLNQWNCIAFKRLNSVFYAYKDGLLVGTKTGFTNNFIGDDVLNIRNGGSGNYAPCKIRAVRVYDNALSDEEIRSNYIAFRQRTYTPVVARTLTAILNNTFVEGIVGRNITATPVSGSGGNGEYFYSFTSAPPGVTINDATGEITGIVNSIGSNNYTIEVRDQLNQLASASFTLNISAEPLVASVNIPNFTGPINSPFSGIPVAGSGGFGTISYSISPALPTNSQPNDTFSYSVIDDNDQRYIFSGPTSGNNINISVIQGTTLEFNVDAQGLQSGQQVYNTAGSYQWTAPVGVTEVSVVCVGAGGAGAAYFGQAGAGGGLAYKNAISVTPGQSYNVTVGAGGVGTGYTTNSANTAAPGTIASCNGGDSSFSNGTITVTATGGQHGGGLSYSGGFQNQQGGSPAGTFDGGGNGGPCVGNYSSGGQPYLSSGGGGAGGYSGNGGTGAGSTGGFNTIVNATAGAGGAGGGAGGRGVTTGNSYGGAGGGGTGLLGEGSNGVAGTNDTSTGTTTQVSTNVAGGGGSGGSRGNLAQESTTGRGGVGGWPGGGGGSGHDTSSGSFGGNGADGGVRIIWGAGRSFPSTNTQDITSSAQGHPFWIKTVRVDGTGNAVTTGITNNGTDFGTITWDTSSVTPGTYYYISEFEPDMSGIISVQAVPDSLTFNTSTGQITGTPNIPYGPVEHTVTVTDQLSPTNQVETGQFALEVSIQPLGAVTSEPSIDVEPNTAINIKPVTRTGGFGGVTYSISPSLPAGFSFDTSTGFITGSSAVEVAIAQYTVTITDITNATASNTFTLSVTQQGSPLDFTLEAQSKGQNAGTFAVTDVYTSSNYVADHDFTGYYKITVPATALYEITVRGCSGGHDNGNNFTPENFGAEIVAELELAQGTDLILLAGQSVDTVTSDSNGAGGGGGTFVATGSSVATAQPLVIAGGGGGSCQNRNGQDNARGYANLNQPGRAGDRSGYNADPGWPVGFGGIANPNDGVNIAAWNGGGFFGDGQFGTTIRSGGSNGLGFVNGATGGLNQGGTGTGGFGGGGGGANNCGYGGGAGGYSGGGTGGYTNGCGGHGGGGGSYVDANATVTLSQNISNDFGYIRIRNI